MSDAVSQVMLSTVDVGDKVVVGLGVDDVGAAMQKFGWPDYVMFTAMLGICISIGLYYGFIKTASSAQDYLMGGRSMSSFPVVMSLIASFISGISLLGIPTEIYVYGIQYSYIVGGFLLSSLAMNSIFLPVFHELQLTSTYEYLDRRFDKKVRLFGSILFSIGLLAWLPLVIYVPALAFNQVTGINVHFITPVVCLICIFYTSMGGLKAVVWTDVIQSLIMLAAILLVTIKGTLDIGGFLNVFTRNWESGRIESPNFDINPLSRHTFWSLTFGGFLHTLLTSGVNQTMIQRYLSLPSVHKAKLACWFFFLGIVITLCLCTYCGLLIYATFHKCDPLTTMLAREKDQLLPLLVMDILGDFPGLPGVFVAGIFSAALSSLSTGLNAMAAVVLEDFYKPFFLKELNEKQTSLLMKLTVVILGVICVGLVFVVEKLGAVLQLSMSVSAISNGPALALFTMGTLLPWVNAKGALAGSSASLVFMSWLCLRTQTLIASGDLTFPEKPVTTEGCHYHFTPKQAPQLNIHFDPAVNITNVTHTDERYMIYRLSYLWYTLVGVLVTVIISLLVSYLTQMNDPRDVDQQLLAPFIRKYIARRNFPNEPAEGIIYAYDPSTLPTNGNNLQLKKVDKAEST